MARGVRRLGGAAIAVLKGLLAAVVISLILFVLAVLIGIVLVEGDTLFH